MKHRARWIALAAVATSFCSSETDDFPQIVQQQQIIGHRIDAAAAVENKLENAGHACRSQYNIRHSIQMRYRACSRKPPLRVGRTMRATLMLILTPRPEERRAKRRVSKDGLTLRDARYAGSSA